MILSSVLEYFNAFRDDDHGNIRCPDKHRIDWFIEHPQPVVIKHRIDTLANISYLLWRHITINRY